MTTFRVDHVHLICPDIVTTKNWYCDILGCKKTFSGDFKGNKVYYLDLNGFNIILIEQLPYQSPLPETILTRKGLDHFGLAVDDMNTAVSELKGKGVRFVVEPLEVRPGVRVAYIEAPYKVRIELTERK